MKFYFEEKHRRKTGLCHNCDNILLEKDNFCNICGQENHDLKVPIPHILEEVLEGVSHFDNKFFTTLKSLFLKPGQITKDFLEGKRTRFVPPLRLFFFISATYFFLYSCSQTKSKKLGQDPVWVAKRITELSITSMLDRLEVKSWDTLRLIMAKKPILAQKKILHSLYLATLQDTLHTHPLKTGPVSRAYFKQLYRDLKLPLPDTILLRGINLDEKVKITLNPNKDYWVVGQGVTKAAAKTYLNYTDRQLDSAYRATEHGEIAWYQRVGLKLTRQYSYDAVVAAEKDENAVSIIYSKTLNYTIILMIPIVGFLLWLFFRKTRPYYYEHLIFSINYHSLLFIIYAVPFYFYLTFGIDFDKLLGGYSFSFILLGMWVYFLISARNIFMESWLKTSVKAIFFGFFYGLLFLVFFIPIHMLLYSMFVND